MKLVQWYLLGSAAGLAAVAGAQAADHPAKKAAGVEYVRVCSAYGTGFFYIPGTETCLRVGGRVRAEVLYTEPFTRADDALAFLARGRIQLDARNQTAYGTLRAFVRMEMTQTGRDGTSSNIAQAFVQFGGLTAGKVTSFFSNPDLPNPNMGSLRFDDSPDIALAAYTFSFTEGFSATLSVEEAGQRRVNDASALVETFVGAPLAVVPGGTRMPDVVGNIRYAGTWGSAQLSGAVHQIRDVGVAPFVESAGPPPVINPGRDFAGTEYGFALMGTVGVNLPMFGAGDAAWFAATYSQGASSYSGFGDLNAGTFSAEGFTAGGVVDATVNPVTGDLKTTRIWSVAGGFTHFWTPTIRTSAFGSYARVEYPGVSSAIVTTGTGVGGVVGFVDFTEWRVGGNAFWSPVSDLDIGVEVLYAQADPRGRIFVPSTDRLESDVGRIEGRIRIQRDF
jgi:hypothetical protein